MYPVSETHSHEGREIAVTPVISSELEHSLLGMARDIYGDEVVGYAPEVDQLRKLELIENTFLGMPQVSIPVRHFFVDGVYAREMLAPAGSLMIGKIHKYDQINILSQGEVSILTPHGLRRVKAPYTVVSPRGTKRAGYVHSDVIWTTIIKTDHTDLATIEDAVAARSVDEYLAFCEQNKLEICP